MGSASVTLVENIMDIFKLETNKKSKLKQKNLIDWAEINHRKEKCKTNKMKNN